MCLISATRVKFQPKPKVVTRWKVLEKKGSAYVSLFLFNKTTSEKWKANTWIKSSSGPGFHVFKTREAARTYLKALSWRALVTVRKVAVKQLKRKGEQYVGALTSMPAETYLYMKILEGR